MCREAVMGERRQAPGRCTLHVSLRGQIGKDSGTSTTIVTIKLLNSIHSKKSRECRARKRKTPEIKRQTRRKKKGLVDMGLTDYFYATEDGLHGAW